MCGPSLDKGQRSSVRLPLSVPEVEEAVAVAVPAGVGPLLHRRRFRRSVFGGGARCGGRVGDEQAQFDHLVARYLLEGKDRSITERNPHVSRNTGWGHDGIICKPKWGTLESFFRR